MTHECQSSGGHVASAYGYRRVSTEEQSASGLGLEAQAAAIEAMAAKLRLPLVAMFTDAGLSGGLPVERRPGLMDALNVLRRGDVLVTAKRDRLGRDVLNVALVERLAERKGARIVSPDAPDTLDPTARLMRQIIDCFAEYERALIRMRTKAALQAKMARGERVGQIPFGFRLTGDGRRLEPRDDEQQVLARLLELRSAGFSLRGIASQLNAEGLRPRCGGRWHHQSVALQVTRWPQKSDDETLK